MSLVFWAIVLVLAVPALAAYIVIRVVVYIATVAALIFRGLRERGVPSE